MKLNKLAVSIKGTNEEIKVVKRGTEDFMSLTEIYNLFGTETGKSIETFIRSSEILDFLSEWELSNNLNFKAMQAHGIKEDAKSRVNLMSVVKWVAQTNAIGIYAIKGKYGGTYAQSTIALRFCAYLSKKLEVTVYEDYIKYKRLEYSLQRSELRQEIADEYKTMCQMIEQELCPNALSENKKWAYTEEADMINRIVFGYTASEWKIAFPHLVVKNKNQRDYCSDAQVECVKRLQLKNTFLIEAGVSKPQRILSLTKQRDITMSYLIKNKSIETKYPLSDLEPISTSLSEA